MKQRRDLSPIILSLLLLLGILSLSFLRHCHGIGAWAGSSFDLDMLFAGLYALWIAAESPVARHDADTAGKRTVDLGTCLVYAMGQAGTILSALWFPSFWHASSPAHFMAIALFLGGVLFRLRAIRTLGRFYSHKVRKLEHHQIVQIGPYHLVRHPAYTGMIASHAGVTLYFCNWVTLGILMLVLAPSIILRIFVEEKMFFAIEGYSEFAQNGKRLFPALW